MDDRMVRAGLCALAAFDTFFLINAAFAVYKGDRALGAYLLTGCRQTILAVLRYPVLIGGLRRP